MSDPLDRQSWSFPENLLRRLDVQANGCIEFTGHRDVKGYGKVWMGGAPVKAHRAMWELMVGPIPDGLTIDHLCRNRACVNPGHLEPVTMGENVRRGQSFAAINAAKTHCKHGHPFDEANTQFSPDGRRRSCRACHAARSAARRAARRSAA